MTATLHVCRSCEGREAVRRRRGDAAGHGLREALTAMLRALPRAARFEIVSQDCMGPCGAGVRVALTGPGRWGWLFQDLEPGDMEALGSFLVAWHTAADGVPAKAERPSRLLRKTVCRLPPSGPTAEAAAHRPRPP